MSKSRLNLMATLRQPAELVAHGLAPAAALGDLEEVASRYAVAVTPDIAGLIDPNDPNVFRFRQETVKENLGTH